jgi:PIN domain nuclease of toxin-antitoxin system
MSLVLDASALLAYLRQETGWEAVHSVIGDSCISAVNWSEVAQKAEQKGLSVAKVGTLLTELGLGIIPFSSEHAEAAAHLWEKTRRHGLSLADRACLALAIEQQSPVLTADRAWGRLDLDI